MITDVKSKTTEKAKNADMFSYIYKKTAKATDMNIPGEYVLDDQGRFQIKHFDRQPAFSSFLPGIGQPNLPDKPTSIDPRFHNLPATCKPQRFRGLRQKIECSPKCQFYSKEEDRARPPP